MAHLQKRIEGISRAVEYSLSAAGEDGVNVARSSNDYLDQTGNLRSSVGYVVKVGDKSRSSRFDVVKKGGKGSATGGTYAQRLADKLPAKAVLVLVAGMPYAAHLERTLQRDVLRAGWRAACRKAKTLLSFISKR